MTISAAVTLNDNGTYYVRTYTKICTASKLFTEITTAGLVANSRFFGVATSGSNTSIQVALNFSATEASTLDSVVDVHVPISLADAQTNQNTKIRTDVTNYIFNHYNQGTQNSMLAAWTEATVKTPPWINREALIQKVWNWVQTILGYYYQQKTIITNTTTIDAANAVTWDFSQFDGTDPNISLAQVIGTTN